ncbi:MAG: 30S ribosomal protein S19e [Nanoarchaeota archaeon]
MNKLVEEIKKVKEVKPAEWAPFVKTGAHKERTPENPDWWFVRAASVLRKVNKFGPIGANNLAKQYGGRKNRGFKPEKKYSGSRNIVRKCLQQLEAAKLIEKSKGPRAGKVITKKGKELLERCN